ncbi:MAG: endonuclease/exonuclease/phosphatase family protein [Planctomycetaceae bacterium]
MVLGRRLRPRGWLVAVALLWLWFDVAYIEESTSLARSVCSRWSEPVVSDSQNLRFRTVSLNCADGALRTAREAAALEPDILLFQESPGRDALEQLAAELFGNSQGVLWSPDTSIVSRWPILPAESKDHFVVGRVQIPNGPTLKVVCLRLAPPVVRYDLWNPACWREQTAKRQQHNKQIQQLVDALVDDQHLPIILGGDFNSAQHDRATWPLRDFARDTFDIAGRGWGNTVLNAIPVLRFDQIWSSEDFAVIATSAVRSQHSDHRLVICDLFLPDNSRNQERFSTSPH